MISSWHWDWDMTQTPTWGSSEEYSAIGESWMEQCHMDVEGLWVNFIYGEEAMTAIEK